MSTILLLATLTGVVTTYTSDEHYGNPLFCDTWQNDLSYRDDLNFIALPFGSDFECGDFVVIRFLEGHTIKAYALDTGPFLNNCVLHDNGQCFPIRADVPSHLWSYKNAISARASVLNVSKLNRDLPPDTKVGYFR